MQIQQKIELLAQLRNYIINNDPSWEEAKDLALRRNSWFIPKFVDQAVEAIVEEFLNPDLIRKLIEKYDLSLHQDLDHAQQLGIIMAGNIPLVGFHDFLMGFLSGYQLVMKPSSKDEVFIRHIVQKLIQWAPELENRMVFQNMLKGCDVYIATGSNNSAQTFEYYFSQYPNLIRHNRTSVAVLTGKETQEELKSLTQDIFSYFGLGCRNISKIWVPENYNFQPLIEAINEHALPKDHHQYLNNFDYQLALVMLNGVTYKSADHLILISSTSDFAPVATLHYQEYASVEEVNNALNNAQNHLQLIVANDIDIKEAVRFGTTSKPAIDDFADGEDTFSFLLKQSGI